MPVMKQLLILIVIIVLPSCKDRKINYVEFKNAQDYHVSLFEDNFTHKTALFIFPHPDDEIVCGGTIVQLKKKGWTIDLLTLTQGQPNERATRTNEWKNAVRALGVDNFEIMDLPNNPWENVLNNTITFWYDQQDSIENIVYHSIQKYKPSIVFTYDTALGAYGHPEHRISAIAVNSIFQKHKQDALFPVESILQITLPEKLEQLLFATSVSYKNAMKITGNKTLPDPTLAFNISMEWNTKRRAAFQYVSQFSSLRRFHQLPEIKDTTDHYNAFDREYYYEIKK
jgi:N-acetylglucosamine malate deacetylase 2